MTRIEKEWGGLGAQLGKNRQGTGTSDDAGPLGRIGKKKPYQRPATERSD